MKNINPQRYKKDNINNIENNIEDNVRNTIEHNFKDYEKYFSKKYFNIYYKYFLEAIYVFSALTFIFITIYVINICVFSIWIESFILSKALPMAILNIANVIVLVFFKSKIDKNK